MGKILLSAILILGSTASADLYVDVYDVRGQPGKCRIVLEIDSQVAEYIEECDKKLSDEALRYFKDFTERTLNGKKSIKEERR